MKPIVIKTKKGIRYIGPGYPVFIIAEMSGNHNHSYKRAQKIIDAAAKAGVDAVKLQTYTPDTMTINCHKDIFKVKTNNVWKGKTLYELYKWAATPWQWQARLKKYAEKRGLVFFSTPFDNTAVDFLEKLKVPIYKVASFEVVDIPLLKKIAHAKKPVIISRGMSSLQELKLAIATLKKHGTPQVAVLHCVSSYPAKPEDMNLKTIQGIVKKLKVITGLSDHSLDSQGGVTIPTASVALGASIIEKHFTLRRSDGGPDAAFSLEPKELGQLVKAVREVEASLGKPTYKVTKKEQENKVFRRSLIIVKNIAKGQKFTKYNLRSIRPGYGLSPKYYDEVIGKVASKNISRGTPLKWSMVKK